MHLSIKKSNEIHNNAFCKMEFTEMRGMYHNIYTILTKVKKEETTTWLGRCGIRQFTKMWVDSLDYNLKAGH